jgi:hypothetical protein
MKLLKAETLMGSVYIINPVSKTWKRTSKSEKSGEIRTEFGQYEGLSLDLGESLILRCLPPIRGTQFRLITTSIVTFVQEYESDIDLSI